MVPWNSCININIYSGIFVEHSFCHWLISSHGWYLSERFGFSSSCWIFIYQDQQIVNRAKCVSNCIQVVYLHYGFVSELISQNCRQRHTERENVVGKENCGVKIRWEMGWGEEPEKLWCRNRGASSWEKMSKSTGFIFLCQAIYGAWAAHEA